MATYRLYLAARLGDGVSHATPFRSKLANYISDDGTQRFWDWSNRATPWRLCLAFCDTTVHATIAADTDITVLSPESADLSALGTWLDGLVGTLPANVATAFENARFPVDWITASTTRRQLWRAISLWHVMVQSANGDGAANALAFIASNLDATVGSLSAAVRNAMSAWMTSRGLDVSQVTGATTIRAVVKGILNSGVFSPVKFGAIDVS